MKPSVLALFLALLSGCAGDAALPLADDSRSKTGQRVYHQHCARCHDSGRSGPSIREPEEWDVRQMADVRIVSQHRSMRLAESAQDLNRLSQDEAADALFYLAQVLNEAELRY
jgi:mono/diheme cytochrome c family protein